MHTKFQWAVATNMLCTDFNTCGRTSTGCVKLYADVVEIYIRVIILFYIRVNLIIHKNEYISRALLPLPYDESCA